MNNPYGSLAWTFFKIGLFGFGGGYAILPLIGHEVVATHGWATSSEFSDMVALSQVTPGAIAINAATYVGLTAGGFWGSLLASAAVCLAPLVLTLLACRFFMHIQDHPRVKGVMSLLRPAVIGFVAAAALSLFDAENFRDWTSIVVFLAAFVATVRFKIHPILLIVVAGIYGFFAY